MFTTGQIIFGGLFAVAFVLILVYAYRKDLALHRKHYKGTVWVLIAFICFVLFILSIKWVFQ